MLKQVVELGIDFAQGYHFGRPQLADTLLRDFQSRPQLLRDAS